MKRLEKLRKAMLAADLAGVFVSKRENLFYLAGFSGSEGSLYVTADRAVVLVDARYEEQARQECVGWEVLRVSAPNRLDLVAVEERTVGFESEHVSVALFETLKKRLPADVVWRDASPLLKDLRLYKDAEEIAALQKAVAIADGAFSHILPFLKPGVREVEIAMEMDFYMRRLGAKGPSFDFIIAAGARSALPHGVASHAKLQQGSVILMDYGCLYEHYCSDITRTVFLGEPTSEEREVYHIVKEGQRLAMAAMTPGVAANLPDQAVRAFFAEKGLAQYFGHSLGHGVGLEVHEKPTLRERSDERLEPGMVFSNEPGIYLAGRFGVRIEDMVYMTPKGAVTMTQSTKDLLVLG